MVSENYALKNILFKESDCNYNIAAMEILIGNF